MDKKNTDKPETFICALRNAMKDLGTRFGLTSNEVRIEVENALGHSAQVEKNGSIFFTGSKLQDDFNKIMYDNLMKANKYSHGMNQAELEEAYWQLRQQQRAEFTKNCAQKMDK